MTHTPSSRICRGPAARIATILLGCLATAISTTGQDFKDLRTPDSPLVLQAQGSFFVGGEKVEQTVVELGNFGPAGHIAVNQMYVRYMVPQSRRCTPRDRGIRGNSHMIMQDTNNLQIADLILAWIDTHVRQEDGIGEVVPACHEPRRRVRSVSATSRSS